MMSLPSPSGRTALLGVPRLPKSIPSRPRLVRLFDEHLETGPMIIVRASKGAGKTTAAADWASLSSRPVAWVNITGEPGPSHAFWNRILRSSRSLSRGTYAHGVLDRAVAAMESGEPLQELLMRTADDLGPVTLILDGVRPGPDTSLLEDLLLLLGAARDFRVIMILADDFPRMHAAMLRSLDVAYVEEQDLQMTLDEVAAQVVQSGSDLDPHDVHSQSSGYALIVRDLINEHRVRPLKGAEDMEKLASSIIRTGLFKHLDGAADHRAFMLETSVTEVLTPELARRLTGRKDARTVLEQLTALRLLRHEGHERYRYSDTARRALFAELAETRPDDVPQLRRILISSSLDAGDIVAALRTAVVWRDFDTAAVILTRHLTRFSFDHRDAVGTILDGVPETDMLRHPVMAMVLGFILSRTGLGSERGRALLETALAGREANSFGTSPEEKLLAPLVEMVAMRAGGRYREAVRRVPAVTEALESGDPERRNLLAGAAVFAYMQSGVALMYEGWGKEARSMFRRAVSAPASSRPDSAFIFATGFLGLSYAISGRITDAEEALRPAEELYASGTTEDRALGPYQLTRALCLLEKGEYSRASNLLCLSEAAMGRDELWSFAVAMRATACLHLDPRQLDLDEMQRLAFGRPARPMSSYFRMILIATLSAAHLAAGNPVRAEEVLAGLEHEPYIKIAKARVLLACGDFSEAERTLPALDSPSRTLSERLKSQTLLLRSSILEHSGRTEQAEAERNQALATARRLGMGPGMYLLPQPSAEHLPGVAGTGEGMPAFTFPTVSRGVRLTARERVVLQMLAASETAADAARELGVALNTVKAQSRSIYRKLGVRSLRDALAEARRTGII